MTRDLDAILTTRRLVLTPIEASDATEMFAVLADPSLGAFAGDEPPSSPQLLRASYEVLAGRRDPNGEDLWLNWIVRLGGVAIGFVQATVARDGAGLAWVIGVDHQRQGFATEAVGAVVAWLRDERRANTFSASIRDDHAASRGVASRIGLVPTGAFRDGERVWRLETSRAPG